MMCAYCGERRAVNRDHVVPRALRKRLQLTDANFPVALLRTVPSCFECNHRKGTRRLVPPSWSKLLPTLQDLLPGAPWRVWTGNPRAAAYRDVHK